MRTSDHFLNYRHMKLIYLLDFRIIFPFIAYVKHFRKINTFMFIATFLHTVFQKTALSKVFFVFSPPKKAKLPYKYVRQKRSGKRQRNRRAKFDAGKHNRQIHPLVFYLLEPQPVGMNIYGPDD